VYLWLHQDTLSYKGWRKVWLGGLYISRKEADSYAGSSATTSRVRPHRPP